jgi:hypothetical protein
MSGDELRVSDADRERTAALLREHHAVGRLTAEEFEDRLEVVFTARTQGDLDALLGDLPAIDLYQLPSASIRPASRAVVRPRARGGTGLDRRGDASLLPWSAAGWVTWTAASSLLLVIWLGVGIASGGAAWLPWFLLIVIPWAIINARRPPDHP